MTENRALWELVEMWREKERTNHGCGDFCDGVAHGYDTCADELAAILERPVVVGDEDVERACDAYECIAGEQPPATHGIAMRATLELFARLTSFPKLSSGDVRLWDTQWMNIVNHDNCYRDWSKDDAIAHAVKMTEEAIARNVAEEKLPPRKDTLESMVRGKS